jgi:hypothetical protein
MTALLFRVPGDHGFGRIGRTGQHTAFFHHADPEIEIARLDLRDQIFVLPPAPGAAARKIARNYRL